MFKTSEKDGYREHMARMGAMRASGMKTVYNTGSAIESSSYAELVQARVRTLLVPKLLPSADPEGDAHMLAGIDPRTTQDQFRQVVDLSAALLHDVQWWQDPPALVTGSSTFTVDLLYRVPSTAADTPRATAQQIITPAQIVQTVRDSFALNVSETADVFHVTRATIYQWSAFDRMDQIRAHAHLARLRAMHDLAAQWRSMGALYGRWQREVLSSGRNLFEMLCDDSLDTAAILAAHAELTARAEVLRQAENLRSIEAARALADAFSKLDAEQTARRAQKDRN